MTKKELKAFDEYDYPFLDKPVPVTDQNWPDDLPPLVSVSCKTYMHENYIRDAIEGFLMQKTTFRVEVLIHDDASTDKTADIVREYEAKHPQLIKTTYQVENQYKKNPKTDKYVKPHPRRGKYVALCEGDDYWTDPMKLQRQVEFLERNPEFSFCTHDWVVFYEHKNIKPVKRSVSHPHLISRKIDGEKAYRISLKDFSRHLVVAHTASIMYRSEFLKTRPPWAKEMQSGDYVRNLMLLKRADGAFLPYVMSVLRKNPGGITQKKRSGVDFYKLISRQNFNLARAVTGVNKFFFIGRLIKAYFEMIVGVKKYKVPLHNRIIEMPRFFLLLFLTMLSFFQKPK